MNTKKLLSSVLVLGFISNNVLSMDKTSAKQQFEMNKKRKILTLQNVGSAFLLSSGALLKISIPHFFMDIPYVQYGIEKAAKRDARILMGLGLTGITHSLYSAVKRPYDSQKTA